MIDIPTLSSQIKRNCNISDAKYWGSYSICGLLLRLRELYRTEQGIRPWETIHREQISQWISEREDLWKEFEDKNFENITIGDNTYSPFEVSRINAVLGKENLIYGAGYGVQMKPSFFLADLLARYTIDGHVVFIGSNEYARDLAYYPAMLQDGVIIGRLDTTKILLWEKFSELKFKNPDSPLTFAFLKYHFTQDNKTNEEIDMQMSELSLSELKIYIHHEIGEAFEGEHLGTEWKNLLVDFSCTKTEFFARSVKDLLADTSEKGMLRYIIDNNKEGSLGFYIVFLQGYRRLLFPEIIEAFKHFMKTGDWKLIEDARMAGYRKAKEFADNILSVYRKHKPEKDLISKHIENEILTKLQ